uniref:RNA-directed RNA polymerase catalytic subunit n=1 Tax=Xiangshan orthomyxo-like virus TaxID=2886237 RepID=A0A8K1P3I0_9ORTO|nr:MAG: RNA-dependent RNA polymerase subunit PB1 [Xiangshan orthomyxo-like virus]
MNLFTPLSHLPLTETQELIYAYTGPPPVAYGTHTKAVLENILRPFKYFFKKENVKDALKIKTGSKELDEINIIGPSSGFHRDSVLSFSKSFYKKYEHAFTHLQRWLNDGLQSMKYAELAKGRQTWSFLQKKNIPAAAALEETVNFLEHNLKRKIGSGILSYLQAIMDVMEMDSTEYKYETYVVEFDFDSEDDADVSEKKILKSRTITRKELWDQMRKLNTMWKHLERGRLQRRTIATPSMLIRGFVKIVEDAARVLLERIDSAGVPVGGEEKLAKLASKLMLDRSKVTGELSGDQEKFNECLDPDAMRMMWEVFLRECGRSEWEIELFSIPFLVFKAKMADMGEGLTFECKGFIEKHHIGESEEYKSEFDDLIEATVWSMKDVYVKGKGVVKMKVYEGIECTLGMFMGMYNLSSTLLSLIAADRPELSGSHVESSDDFIHFIYTDTVEEMFKQVETLRLSQKLVGINFSPSKCILISPAGIGEFNSKYHYKEFVGNIATELPALFPNGLNPSSDLAMGLNVIKQSLSTNQMNMLTGSLALRLFVKSYKYCYMSEGINPRTKFMEEANCKKLLLNQGADPVHSISTLHLDEIALRFHLGLLEQRDLNRLLNPANPITGSIEPVITYRWENKMPVELDDPSLGSSFKFEFSRNRTIMNRPDRVTLEIEKDYKEITRMVSDTHTELLINSVDLPGTVCESVEHKIRSLIQNSDYSLSTKEELLQELVK